MGKEGKDPALPEGVIRIRELQPEGDRGPLLRLWCPPEGTCPERTEQAEQWLSELVCRAQRKKGADI